MCVSFWSSFDHACRENDPQGLAVRLVDREGCRLELLSAFNEPLALHQHQRLAGLDVMLVVGEVQEVGLDVSWVLPLAQRIANPAASWSSRYPVLP